MPTLLLNTNVAAAKAPAGPALRALSKAVASSVGKPEQYVCVALNTDRPMLFGGSDDACAYGELVSIGALGGAKNKAISKAVSAVVEEHLGVPSNRFYLKFVDVAGSDFGWSGSTF